MKAALRRGAFAATLAALWATPTFLPFHEGPDPAGFTAGWYVAFVLGAAWPTVVLWAFLGELARFEGRSDRWARVWSLSAIAVGLTAVVVDGFLMSPYCGTCETPRSPTTAALVHHILLTPGGIALALAGSIVLVSRMIRRPVLASRTLLRLWATGINLVLFLTPPYFLHTKAAQVMALIVAYGLTLLRGLPALEDRFPRRKLVLRGAVIAAGVVGWVVPVIDNVERAWRIFVLHAIVAVKLAGVGAGFIVLCMTAADLLGWIMRGSRSVRERMLILGICCTILAVAIARLNVPFETPSEPSPTTAVFTILLKIVLVGVATYAFASALARRLSRSLEQSARAISEIRRGNLDVSLDDSGRDEVAAVARTFNEMVAMLREAEFLEQINSDLQSRSKQLVETLEALRAAQTDLVRAERMASVATLVKGIAHELNNPINYIAGNVGPLVRYSSFLSEVATQLSDGRARGREELTKLTRLTEGKDLTFVTEDLTRLTADIGEGARRAQLIIRDLQGLTSAAQRQIERVDLHRVVRQTMSLLGPRLPPGVRFETDLAPAPSVPARAGQLEQVLVNLTDNALRAVGDRGVIRIRVTTDGGHVVVKVSDDGPGMDEQVRRQAFEPFFTTRVAGEGSGLGLAIVASIVRAHRGTVTIASEVGKGTEVELRLPVDADLLTEAELGPVSARA